MLSKLFGKKKREKVIYTLFDKPIHRAILGVWEKHMWQYTEVIGYSATGAIFLFSPETCEYLVFYPSMPGSNSKGYGVFDSLQEFKETILDEEGFPEYCLYPINPEDLESLENKLGSLDLEGFDKGNIWVRTEILGQNRGIE
ncbi:hypothetical protein ORJ00_14425 [Rheinheimera baltica]|uniref:hypothetical protein n=1 Tax=Rheinheimera baltica TaxID=67576 RepID=UPI00273ECE64|nr:hypothetical protein [Rheinheimera baltica]MDP5143940.1 hypothetical protein [Rheinheimera baltica]